MSFFNNINNHFNSDDINSNEKNEKNEKINKNNCNICNICYEEKNNNKIITLSCCKNTKKICYDCISCLTTHICPYCRKILPENISFMIYKNNINNQVTLSSSAPAEIISQENINDQWNTFIENEYLIDPFADYYHNRDSRILRRQIRQLRKRFLHQSLSRQQTNVQRRQNRRDERQNLRNYTNRLTQYYQRNNSDVSNNSSNNDYEEDAYEEDIFDMDDIDD